jgi:hypothetical protein
MLRPNSSCGWTIIDKNNSRTLAVPYFSGLIRFAEQIVFDQMYCYPLLYCDLIIVTQNKSIYAN